MSVAANGREPRSGRSPRVLVVGAGIGGIATAIELRRQASRTSRSSSGRATWAGPGSTTPTRGRRATCPATSTRSPTPSAGTGRGCARRRRRSTTTCTRSRALRRRAARAHGQTVTACSWDEDTCDLDGRDLRGRAPRGRRDRARHRPAAPAARAADPGGRRLRRHTSSTPPYWDHSYDLRGKRVGRDRQPGRAPSSSSPRSPRRCAG